MSADSDPVDAIQAAELAAGEEDWQRAHEACLEAISRIQYRKQEGEK